MSDNKPNQLIVNQITVTQIKRESLDVGKWREVAKYAEGINPNRAKLLDMCNDIRLDEHVTSEVNKLILAVTNAELLFTNDNNEQVTEIMKLIDTTEMEDVLTHFVESKLYPACSLMEVEPANKKFIPHFVERKNIYPETGTVRFDQHNEDGIKYREGTYKYFTIETGKQNELGLLYKAAFWVIIKRCGIGDWLELCEVFGMPTRVGEYDAFDEPSRIELQKALDEMATGNRIMKPKGTEISLIESKATSPGDLHSGLIDLCNKAISILFLGQTLTTLDKSGSGQAQGTVHAETKEDIVKSYKRYVRRILNNKLKPVLENLGYNVTGGKFIFRDQVPIAERLKAVELLQAVKDLGAPVDDEQVYEQSGVTKPKNYDALKAEIKANKPDTQPTEPNTPPSSKKPKDKAANKQQKRLNWWLNFRTVLADFFDPALKH